MLNRAYRDEMASWLETIEWDYFATFTTPYSMTLKSARRIMEKYHSKMDGMMFWVAEKYELKDGYHTHALLKSKWPKEDLWELWQICSVYKSQVSKREDGHVYNRCDIQPRDYRRRAGEYMSKYLLKSHADYDILI